MKKHVTIRMDSEVHHRVKILAAEDQTTLGQLLEDALRILLREKRGRRIDVANPREPKPKNGNKEAD